MQRSSEEEGSVVHVVDTVDSSTSTPEFEKEKCLGMDSYFGAFRKGNKTANNIRDDSSSMMGDEELVAVSRPSRTNGNATSSRDDGLDGPVISIIPPLHVESQDAPGGFDVCKEYGYKYEYTEDYDEDADADFEENGEERSETSPLNSNSSKIASTQDPMHVDYRTYLLGRSYHPILDYALCRSDESSLFWFTYRCDFPEIKPYGITSDAGWGCMLRSAQMLFAQALRMHYCGRGYISPQSTVQKRSDPFIQDLFTWFADFSSFDTGCWYSLQNMVAAGLARYETLPGEWFGPGTACHILKDLVDLHVKSWERKFGQDRSKAKKSASATSKAGLPRSGYQRDHPVMKVYLAQEGCVYCDDVNELMTKKSSQFEGGSESKKLSPKLTKRKTTHDPISHPLSSNEPTISSPQLIWDTSVLILIPLRLGLKSFNASSYSTSLAHSFSLPQSVGFVGGYPRHALWFYGAQSDGSKLYGLDPHTIQSSPSRRRLKPEEELRTGSTKQYQVQLSDGYLRSAQCQNPRRVEASKIDPSLALGFYCRDRTDFEAFCTAIKMEKEFPALFSIADAKPDYSADVSSAMVEMMMGSSSQLGEGEADGDDDDDYVML